MIINDTYTFQLDDIGQKTLTITFSNGFKIHKTITVTKAIEPNLRSTELDGSHLFFLTSDGEYLNVGG